MKNHLVNKTMDKHSLTNTDGVKHSRRKILKGAGLVIIGGLAGQVSRVAASQKSAAPPAPPLPWKWIELDPMEAGTLAYESYLKKHGG